MQLKPESAVHKFGSDIYIGNADDLWDKIEPLFIDPRTTTVIFDMENVRVCDSYGIRLLLICQRRAEAEHKKLLLLKPDRLIREMFQSIRLDTVFTMVDSAL